MVRTIGIHTQEDIHASIYTEQNVMFRFSLLLDECAVARLFASNLGRRIIW